MTPQETCAIALVVIAVLLIVVLPKIVSMQGRDHWYDQGWKDCEKAHNHFELTPDDEIVLRHLKLALRAYIKAKRYQRKGDVKKVAQIDDFGSLKHATWEICERDRRTR